jgi:hypothetical protein
MPPSRHSNPADLIIAEGPMGGNRRRRLPPIQVRLARSSTFLLTCFTATAVVGLIVYNVDKADLPSQSNAAMLWQTFEATMGQSVIVAVGMWLVHLATTLFINRIRRQRASEGVTYSAFAGILAYPFYLGLTAIIEFVRPSSTGSHGLMVYGAMLVIPAVTATILAPLLIHSITEGN